MPPVSPTGADVPTPAMGFHTTHWSVVLAAKESSSPQAHEALATLCRTYWYPLHAYGRQAG